jgi:hypothetical protein
MLSIHWLKIFYFLWIIPSLTDGQRFIDQTCTFWQAVFSIKSHLNLEISTSGSHLAPVFFIQINEVNLGIFLLPWQKAVKLW